MNLTLKKNLRFCYLILTDILLTCLFHLEYWKGFFFHFSFHKLVFIDVTLRCKGPYTLGNG